MRLWGFDCGFVALGDFGVWFSWVGVCWRRGTLVLCFWLWVYFLRFDGIVWRTIAVWDLRFGGVSGSRLAC